MKKHLFLLLIALLAWGGEASAVTRTRRVRTSGNPILPEFHADPEIMFSHLTNRFYIYSTTDGVSGWGGYYFTAFSSADLVDWKHEGIVLDLGTDQVPWASGNAWAPAIMERLGDDGQYNYYFYYSGHDFKKNRKSIGVAIANTPVGPFYDLGTPLIDFRPEGLTGGQQIDVDVFNDPVTGDNYIYWGNGYMAVAKLNEDMVSIDTTSVKVITPPNGTLENFQYREAPYVFYRKGIYYFMWSVDDTGSPNYHVAYGTSSSPMGPITVAEDCIVLMQEPRAEIYGTAHNSVIQVPGKDEWYIVYHRINKNYIDKKKGPGYHREVCIDRMTFNPDGTIAYVRPTKQGILPVKPKLPKKK